MPVIQKPVRSAFFNFDFTLLERVRTEYDLDPPLALRPILLDGRTATLMEVRSKTSRKAVVATPTAHYFLKEVPWYCDKPEFLTFSHALQRQLHAAGAPVPGICLTRDGGTWLEHGGHRLTLTSFVQGSRFAFTPGQARAAGSALAVVHDRQDAASLPAYRGDEFVQLIRDHIELIGVERPDVAGLLRRDALPELGRLLAACAARLADDGFADLPEYAVHGDFNPWNVSFAGDQVTGDQVTGDQVTGDHDHSAGEVAGGQVAGIFDFDNSDRQPRLHDVAEGLVTFSGAIGYRCDSTRFGAVSASVPDDLARSFLAGYDLARLADNELRMLPYVCGLIGIEFACLGLLRSDFVPAMADELTGWIAGLPGQAARWLRGAEPA